MSKSEYIDIIKILVMKHTKKTLALAALGGALMLTPLAFADPPPGAIPPDGDGMIQADADHASIHFITDILTNSGKEFRIKTDGGATGLEVLANGNVGIGTSGATTEELQVAGDIQANNFYGNVGAESISGGVAFGLGASANYAFPAALGIGTGNTGGLPAGGLYVSGQVGIGISTPLAGRKLHVSDSGPAFIRLTGNSGPGGTVGIEIENENNWWQIGTKGTNEDGAFIIWDGDTADANGRRLTIDAQGRVGIGVNAPDAENLLHVRDGSILVDSTTPKQLATERNAGVRVWRDEAFGLELHNGIAPQSTGWATAVFGRSADATALRFGAYPANSTAQSDFQEYMTILNNGNVGINNVAPAYRLDVGGSINAADILINGQPFQSVGGFTDNPEGFFAERIIFEETWPTNNSLAGSLGPWTAAGAPSIGSSNSGVPPHGNYIGWHSGNNTTITSPGLDLKDYAQIDGSSPGGTETLTETRVFLKAFIYTDSMDSAAEYAAIEVYDGAAWNEVYRDQSNEDAGTNAGWKMATADVTPHINRGGNTQMRISAPFVAGGADYVSVGRIVIYESNVPTRLGKIYLGKDETKVNSQVTFGKTETTTEGNLPYISHKSITNPGATNDLQLAARSTGGSIYLATGNGTPTNNFVVRADGSVGIGELAPEAKLHVTGDARFNGHLALGATGNLKTDRVVELKETFTDGTGNQHGIVTQTTFNLTATNNRALYGQHTLAYANDINENGFDVDVVGAYSEAEISEGSEADDVYGAWGQADLKHQTGYVGTGTGVRGYTIKKNTGETNNIQGGQFMAINTGTGPLTTARGVYAYGRNDDGAVSNLYGGQFMAINETTGNVTTVDNKGNAIGVIAYVDTDGGLVDRAFGGKFYVQSDEDVSGTSQGTITAAYGVHSQVYESGEPDEGSIGTGYALYGLCQDATTCYGARLSSMAEGGTAWGLYVENEDKNYFSGDVGIGTESPGHALEVNNGSYFSRMVEHGNTTGAKTINWDEGNVQHIILTGNTTLTFTGGQSGARYVLVVKQDAGGNNTLTWPVGARFPGGGVFNITQTGSKTDYVGFIYNGVDNTYDNVAFSASF